MLDAADQLEAAERLDRIEDGAAGAGLLKRHDSQRLIGRLKRRTRAGEPSLEASAPVLEGMGIQVVREEAA